MRPLYLLVAALLLAPAVVSAGNKTGGEEFYAIDLTALPDGAMYFLKCSNPEAKGATDCGFLSLWEQTNDVRGLQTSVLTQGRAWEPDTLVLS